MNAALGDTVKRSTENSAPSKLLDQWITWELKQADRLDPLAAFSYCTKRDRRNDPSLYHNDPDSKTDFDLSWQHLLIHRVQLCG